VIAHMKPPADPRAERPASISGPGGARREHAPRRREVDGAPAAAEYRTRVQYRTLLDSAAGRRTMTSSSRTNGTKRDPDGALPPSRTVRRHRPPTPQGTQGGSRAHPGNDRQLTPLEVGSSRQ